MNTHLYDFLFPQPDKVPALRHTEHQPAERILVWCRLHHEGLGWTWYLTECDRASGAAFGYVDGDYPEWGSFDLDELLSNGVRALPDRRPLPITHYVPRLLPAADLAAS